MRRSEDDKVAVVETVLGMVKKCGVIWSGRQPGWWKVDWTPVLLFPVAFMPSAGFAGEQVAFNARASPSRQLTEVRFGRGEDFFRGRGQDFVITCSHALGG